MDPPTYRRRPMSTMRDEMARRGWTDEDLSTHWRHDGYTLSPGRYIEDRAEWESKRVDVRDLLPVGTVLALGAMTARVVEYAPAGAVRLDVGGKRLNAATPSQLWQTLQAGATVSYPEA